MTASALFREPTVLDSVRHRQLRMMSISDHSVAAGMHISYLSAIEFAAAALEFAILFVRTGDGQGEGGKMRVSPVVLLGLMPGENLFVEGTRWDGRYVPNYIRRYPFWTALPPGQTAPSVMFDSSWRGFSETQGEPLFQSDGKPAARLAEIIRFVETFDTEVARTQVFCDRLVELDVLRAMTATVNLPDASEHELSGFFVVDSELLRALPEADVIDIHRNGMLGLIHAHALSLSNMQMMVLRKAKRSPAATA